MCAHQLRALGHTAEWCDTQFIPRSDGYNIIVEGFDQNSEPLIADAYAKGCRFIIIATEEPTEWGFNHGVVKHMNNRQQMFPSVAKYADAILPLVPGTERWYGQFAPAACIELGYVKTLERPKNYHLVDHDFGFYGSKTPRREKILLRLMKKMNTQKAVRVLHNFAEQQHRDDQMQRSRIIVQIRAHNKMGLLSNSRCNTALHLGRAVVAEPHEASQSSPWSQIIHFSETEEAFYEDAVRYRGFWQSMHDKQMERFRDILTPAVCIGRQLEQVGIVPLRAAA